MKILSGGRQNCGGPTALRPKHLGRDILIQRPLALDLIARRLGIHEREAKTVGNNASQLDAVKIPRVSCWTEEQRFNLENFAARAA